MHDFTPSPELSLLSQRAKVSSSCRCVASTTGAVSVGHTVVIAREVMGPESGTTLLPSPHTAGNASVHCALDKQNGVLSVPKKPAAEAVASNTRILQFGTHPNDPSSVSLPCCSQRYGIGIGLLIAANFVAMFWASRISDVFVTDAGASPMSVIQDGGTAPSSKAEMCCANVAGPSSLGVRVSRRNGTNSGRFYMQPTTRAVEAGCTVCLWNSCSETWVPRACRPNSACWEIVWGALNPGKMAGQSVFGPWKTYRVRARRKGCDGV